MKCPSGFISGTTKLRLKAGSSQWWFAAQPQDFQHQITKMTVNGNVVELDRSKFFHYWLQSAAKVEFELTFYLSRWILVRTNVSTNLSSNSLFRK